MNTIQCPQCGAAFSPDGADYAQLVQQVRGAEFDKAVAERLALADEQRKSDIAAAVSQALADAEKKNSKMQSDLNAKAAKAQAELTALKGELADANKVAQSEFKVQLKDVQAAKDAEIAALKASIDKFETEKALAVTQAVTAIEKERDKTSLELVTLKQQKVLDEKNLKEHHAHEVKDREDEIERLRSMKAKQSVKMLGETLEQHCETEFENVRAMGFHQAYFEKDNEVVNGSKGDYVFRDHDDDGTEFVSIMFEMKNEADDSVHKHRNKDFLAKLDRDRIAKKCDYAVLVSMLEPENNHYNQGIVEVPGYERMYVIRPQFFIPIISLIRNAARGGLGYKKELARIEAQNVDVANLKGNLESFQTLFLKYYGYASSHFTEGMRLLDRVIDQLNKLREELRLADKSLRLAKDKTQKVEMEDLLKDSPILWAQLTELEARKEIEPPRAEDDSDTPPTA